MSRPLGSFLGFTPTPSVAAAPGVWQIRDHLRYRAANAWPPLKPALLLHFDGTNGSTTFTDSSDNAIAVTAAGGAQISTAQSKFGGASLYTATNGDHATFTNSLMTDLSKSDFSIEVWIYRTASCGRAGFVCCDITSVIPFALGFGDFTQGSGNGDHIVSFGFYGPSWTQMRGTSTVALNTWTHVAVARIGAAYSLYVNGTKEGSMSPAAAPGTGNGKVYIGRGWDTFLDGRQFRGHIDEVRILRGSAAYTGNFTPPSSPF